MTASATKQAIEEVKRLEYLIANENPPDWRMKAGFDMQRNQAKQNIKPATKAAVAEVKKLGMAVFLMGDEAQGLVEYLKEQTEVAEVSLETLFAPVYDMVEASIGKSREFGSVQFNILERELRQMALANDIVSLPNVSFEGNEYVKDKAATVALAKKYTQKICGAELTAIAVENSVFKQAYSMDLSAPVLPVIITGASQTEATELAPKVFRGNQLAVNVSAANKEVAIEVLKTIKKSLKNVKE